MYLELEDETSTRQYVAEDSRTCSSQLRDDIFYGLMCAVRDRPFVSEEEILAETFPGVLLLLEG